jgi:glycosyltransferase involved in cell wall biosynthesis
MVLGIRGFPDVQGGIETHAEQLYPRLVRLGCEVEAIVRTRWVPKSRTEFAGISLRRIWAPKSSALETVVHSLLGVVYAAFRRPDVLHIHAIGPAIVTPIARLFGLTVVVTNHGPDYNRDKWGSVGRAVLRLGERLGMRWAQGRIVISRVIEEHVRERYGRESDRIPNGVTEPKAADGKEHLERFGLEPLRYVLQVSRLVPEKRQLELIRAFKSARLPSWRLALVGGLDGSNYCREVRLAAAEGDRVVLTGLLTGEPLRQVFANAAAFVLPSSHEGLPIALLEALSYGLPVVASDIPANLELALEPHCYFPLGDVVSLAERLSELASTPPNPDEALARRAWVLAKYDWDKVALDTMAVYRRVVAGERSR